MNLNGKKFAVTGLLAACALGAGAKESFDVVIYGSSPAALTAAIEAQKLGKTAVIVCPEKRIGGLTTGGLGQTDIGNKSAFGGLSLQFYRDVADYYKDASAWKWQKRDAYIPDGQCSGTKGEDSMWTFEPSAALKILERWEREHKLDIRRGEFLDRQVGKVKVEGQGEQRKIVSIRTLSGKEFAGKMFVDATYEGDLMAAAGVSYTVGREPNAQYGETISGIATKAAGAEHHQFLPMVDPYVTKGDPKSGLLPWVEPYDPNEKEGDGDKRVQAYCFRMCLTDVPENRIPFAKPASYDERNYELLFRNMEVLAKKPELGGWSKGVPWINSKMPNRKTDTNNCLGFSTDFVGQNWAWPEASYAERAKILQAHLDYQQGLMWALANHPRVPDWVRNEVSKWGTCKDEFEDGLGNGWQTQLYVREARRLVGDYVELPRHARRAASRRDGRLRNGLPSRPPPRDGRGLCEERGQRRGLEHEGQALSDRLRRAHSEAERVHEPLRAGLPLGDAHGVRVDPHGAGLLRARTGLRRGGGLRDRRRLRRAGPRLREAREAACRQRSAAPLTAAHGKCPVRAGGVAAAAGPFFSHLRLI